MGNGMRERRETLGLTQREVARWAGCSAAFYGRVEKGQRRAGDELRRRLDAVLNEEQVRERRVSEEAQTRRALWPLAQIKEWHFVPGKVYRLGRVFSSDDGGRDPYDKGTKLRYLGKQGVHHIFQSTKAGWLTSYTDVQLMGVHVMG